MNELIELEFHKTSEHASLIDRYIDIFFNNSLFAFLLFIVVTLILNFLLIILFKLRQSLLKSILFVSAINIFFILLATIPILSIDFKKGYYQSEQYEVIKVENAYDDNTIGKVKIGDKYTLKNNKGKIFNYIDEFGALQLKSQNTYQIKTKEMLVTSTDEVKIDLDEYLMNSHSKNYDKLINVVKIK